MFNTILQPGVGGIGTCSRISSVRIDFFYQIMPVDPFQLVDNCSFVLVVVPEEKLALCIFLLFAPGSVNALQRIGMNAGVVDLGSKCHG